MTNKVNDITPQTIIKWQDEINNQNFSYNYRSKLYALLYNLFNFAVEYYELSNNPVKRAGRFKNLETKKEMLIWTEQEFKDFISVVDNFNHKVFFTLLYLTGCRKGEALKSIKTKQPEFNVK